MAILIGGYLSDSRVTFALRHKIEHEMRALNKIVAIVIHQTNSDTAYSALQQWQKSPLGAHFLIDRGGAEYKENGRIEKSIDGKIYQTADITRVCRHVGKIRSRCLATLSCVVAPNQKQSQSAEAKTRGEGKLSRYEHKKTYPLRYPTNDDSIGIEIVTRSEQNRCYPDPTRAQAESALWLIEQLMRELPVIGQDGIFAHGEISYKDEARSEGTGVLRASGLTSYPFRLLDGKAIGKK